ncbi:hypothetical protein NDU88_011709 [Pleurodeles waltl]|uniref:Uncharacterized protein n=1 Tax=Pleurodeles waltl TaxID=8319 RepID=A0AAV7QY14_PLEWA|nr:hypothetical protein NDU88_011709 [Pleurodeles waltl]
MEGIQKGNGGPALTKVTGESRQRRALPEADNLERQTEQTAGPKGEEVEVGQSQNYLTPPEAEAGTSRENPAAPNEVTSPTLRRALTKGPLKGEIWLKSQPKRKEAITATTIEEEADMTRKEDLNDGELNGDCRLNRKRFGDQRYAGPE